MRLVTSILLFILWPGLLLAQNPMFRSQNYAPASGGSIAYTGQTCDNASGSGTTLTCTITVSAGNLLIICESGDYTPTNVMAGAATATLVKSAGAWYSGRIAACWDVPNVAAGSTLVSVNYPSSTAHNLLKAIEISGASTSSPIDVSNSGIVAGTTLSSGNVTTTAANELAIGFVVMAGSAPTLTAGTGYTLILGSTSLNLAFEYGPTTAIGTYSATFNASASVNNATFIVTVKS